MRRYLALLASLLFLLFLNGCGAAEPDPIAQQAPIIQTVVVTRIVTATPLPATSTPVATSPIPQDTPLAITPPTAEVAPAPAGRTANTTRKTNLFRLPDEAYEVVTTLESGITVQVLYRGGLWFQVAAGVERGWLYQDWINLPADQYGQVLAYPEALPVITGKLAQQVTADSVSFTGKVLNIGARTAYGVIVEIELLDASGTRVGVAQALVDGSDLLAGANTNFTVTSSTVSGWQTIRPLLDWRDHE